MQYFLKILLAPSSDNKTTVGEWSQLPLKALMHSRTIRNAERLQRKKSNVVKNCAEITVEAIVAVAWITLDHSTAPRGLVMTALLVCLTKFMVDRKYHAVRKNYPIGRVRATYN